MQRIAGFVLDFCRYRPASGTLIVVDEPIGEAGPRARTAVYAWVSSADRKADLDRRVARVTARATDQQIPVNKVIVEVASALNGHLCKFLVLQSAP